MVMKQSISNKVINNSLMWNKDFVSKSDIAWQLSVIVYFYFKGKTLRKMQMF